MSTGKIVIPKLYVNGHEWVDLTMELSGVNVTAGENGTGKTLLNIMMFFATHMSGIEKIVQAYTANTSVTTTQVLMYANEVIDSVFGDETEIYGRYTVAFTTGNITLTFEDSKLVRFVVDSVLTDVRPATYISNNCNSMSIIKKYSKQRRAMGIPDTRPLLLSEMVTLAKDHRLFDLMYMEDMLVQLNSMGTAVYPLNQYTDGFKDLGDAIRYENDNLYLIKGVTEKSLSNASKGINSIVLMLVLNSKYGKPLTKGMYMHKVVVDSKGVAVVIENIKV